MPLDCPPDTASCSHVHVMTPISGTGPPTVSTTLSCNTPGTTSSLSKDNLLLELELERSRRIALELENDTLTKTVQAGSVVVPMKILFRDEKYVTENVAILGDLSI